MNLEKSTEEDNFTNNFKETTEGVNFTDFINSSKEEKKDEIFEVDDGNYKKIHTGGFDRYIGGWSDYEINKRHDKISEYNTKYYYGDVEFITGGDIVSSVNDHLEHDPLGNNLEIIAARIKQIKDNCVANDDMPLYKRILCVMDTVSIEDIKKLKKSFDNADLKNTFTNLKNLLSQLLASIKQEIDVNLHNIDWDALEAVEFKKLSEDIGKIVISSKEKYQIIKAEEQLRPELRSIEINRGDVAEAAENFIKILAEILEIMAAFKREN